jgi:hypothetical protein
MQNHREKASGAPPPRSVEKKHEAFPRAVAHEERRTVMNKVSEQPRPARQEAPPPQASQPRPGPPPAAAASEHPQPKGQPSGAKKEKPQG